MSRCIPRPTTTATKLQKQTSLAGALFERVALSPTKLAPPVREIHPQAASVFRDSYLVEFLDLPKDHSKADLHDALVSHLKDFLIELDRDFCFVGSHYALSRSASPALVAEYQTRLPDKKLLQAKLHEFYESAQNHAVKSLPRTIVPFDRRENGQRPKK